MDTAQWPQEAALARPMEAEAVASMGGRATNTTPVMVERRIRRQNDQQQLNCPRCNSSITKFCYYNNYSLTQPRYFCKTCRRYWTEGGSLRNVPVGGGSRKNKRSSAAAATSNANISAGSSSMQNPKFSDQGQDLNLGFTQARAPGLPEMESFSNMEILRGGGISAGRQGSSSFMHEVFGLQDFRGSALGLGFQVGAGGAHDHDEGRLLFSSSGHDGELEQNRGQGGDTQGFWNGMIGGGGAW